MKGERTADNVDFARDAQVVEAGASAGGFRWIEAGEGAEESGGGGGVANSHFPCAESFGVRGVRKTGFDGLLGLGAGHGGFAGEIAGRMADAHVDDDGFDIRVAAEDVNRRAAGAEIRGHLPGDFRWIRADAFFDHAVVGAENHHRFAADFRRFGGLNQAELQRQILESAEAAWGFCE